jgi:hypothetical protein
MDHAKKAKKLRDRAEECRALAKIMRDQESRAAYLSLAQSYETLAKHEEAMIGLAHNTVNSPSRKSAPRLRHRN